MEQRTFLAIALSLLVLLAYNSYLQKNFSPKREIKLEPIENKEVIYNKASDNETISEAKLQVPIVEEEIKTIGNEEIELQFSNIGGKLKNILISKYDLSLPIDNGLTISGFEETPFQMTVLSQGKLELLYEDNEVKIRKFLNLRNSSLIDAIITIEQKSEMSKEKELRVNLYSIDYSFLQRQIK